MTTPTSAEPVTMNRRQMLQWAGLGFGTLALVGLLQDEGLLEGEASAAAAPGLAPGKAKSVIFLFMGGGPSQVDTFDPKPQLDRLRNRAVPESIARGAFVFL